MASSDRQRAAAEEVRRLVDAGEVLVEDAGDDYASVVVGPEGDTLCVATGHVIAAEAIVSVDLGANEATTALRWFAYDDTLVAAPGSRVGSDVVGYATMAEAILAVVSEYGKELSRMRQPA